MTVGKQSDPRRCSTLDEAARNPDGTYNAIKALSWLSAALSGGKGLSEEEVASIAEEVKRDRA